MHKRILLITGASSDIGLSLIQKWQKPGDLVIAHCHTRSERLRELKQMGDRALEIMPCDFSDEKATQQWAASVSSSWGCPTHVVHLPAPKFQYVRFKKSNWETMQRSFDIEIRSVFALLQRVLPAMAERKSGKVLFMLSSFTFGVPPRALTHYCATKYGLLGLMKSLASEFADKGIEINAVSPTTVETSFLSELPSQILEAAREGNPRRRTVAVDEVASFMNVLLSDEVSFLTGANIPLSGGETF